MHHVSIGRMALGGRPLRRPSRTSDTSRWHHQLDIPTTSTMRLSSFGLVALGAATVNAFRDTSPFFLASTSE
jgi:hypothetical protein